MRGNSLCSLVVLLSNIECIDSRNVRFSKLCTLFSKIVALLIEALCPVLSAWSLIADLISGLTPGLCSAQRDFHDLLLSPTYLNEQSGHSNL
jgi:hypothetical protein